jgi:hypothetical protein
MIELAEPINVWVFFQGSKISPYLFVWKQRRIKIDQVNLVHTSREGSALIYYFSVESEGNFYRLRFDSLKLKWTLEAVEEE